MVEDNDLGGVEEADPEKEPLVLPRLVVGRDAERLGHGVSHLQPARLEPLGKIRGPAHLGLADRIGLGRLAEAPPQRLETLAADDRKLPRLGVGGRWRPPGRLHDVPQNGGWHRVGPERPNTPTAEDRVFDLHAGSPFVLKVSAALRKRPALGEEPGGRTYRTRIPRRHPESCSNCLQLQPGRPGLGNPLLVDRSRGRCEQIAQCIARIEQPVVNCLRRAGRTRRLQAALGEHPRRALGHAGEPRAVWLGSDGRPSRGGIRLGSAQTAGSPFTQM